MATLWEIGLANALVVGLAAPVAWLLVKVARRPALAHAVWVVLLIKLVMPPLARLPIWLGPAEVARPAFAGPAELPTPPTVIGDLAEPVAPAPPGATSTPVPVVPESPSAPQWSWPGLLGSIWVAGSAGWLILAGWRIARFARVVRGADAASAELSEWVAELSSQIGLRRPPRVAMAAGRVSPMVWALGTRPTLLVPEGLWARLDHEQRAALLVHELAHLRRGDHRVRILELVATGLYWWHPALWLVRRELHRAEEACCDSWVVWAMPKAKRPYASALVEAVEFLSEAWPRRLPEGASGMGQVEDLSRRIGMIMRGETPRGLGRAGTLAAIGLGLLLVPWQPTIAQDAPKGKDAKPATPSGDDPKPKGVEGPDVKPRTIDDLDARVRVFLDAYSREVGSDPAKARQSEDARANLAEVLEQYKHGISPRAEVIASMAALEALRTKAELDRRTRERSISEAQDTLELAGGKLQSQKARTMKAEAQYKLAMSQMARVRRHKVKAPGSVSHEEEERATGELAIAEALIQEAKADEDIARIEVQQARRKRAEVEGQSKAGGAADAKVSTTDLARPMPRNPQERMDELESKLDRLLKEVEAMRKEAAATPRKAPDAEPEKARDK